MEKSKKNKVKQYLKGKTYDDFMKFNILQRQGDKLVV